MSAQPWLEKAERLRSKLARLRPARPADAGVIDIDEQEALERLTIARWLRAEFSDEPPEDTETLALFPNERAESTANPAIGHVHRSALGC